MSDNKNQRDENIKNKVSQVDESSKIEDDFLQEELQELQAAEDQAKEDAKADFTPLLNKIKELENQLQEKDEIAKNSQINYLHLKADFDILQRQTQQKVDNAERDSEIKVVKELLPFVENLRKSLLNLTDDQKESSI
jgi:molecular chaperone GrpE (heat shock protein)|nr:nucleotide exchange factor GrpE [bacterium]